MSTTMMFIHGAWLVAVVIAFKSFPGHSRFLCAEPGWGGSRRLCDDVGKPARKMKITDEVTPDLARAFLRGRR